jgi:hypothetical protein
MLFADLAVDTGLGKDLVIMLGDLGDVDNRDEMAGVFGDVLLNTGGGEDHVALSSVTIWGTTRISSGQSRDTVSLSGDVGLDGLIRAEAIESVLPFEPVGFEFWRQSCDSTSISVNSTPRSQPR